MLFPYNAQLNILQKTFEDIRNMKIRGAGRIARVTVKALEEYSSELDIETKDEFKQKIEQAGEYLKTARPTAVSLPNAINYVITNFEKRISNFSDMRKPKEILKSCCDDFIRRSELAIEKIGIIGSKRIQNGDILLTHCNSQAAISVIMTTFRQGKKIKVFCTETRPKGQGLQTSSALAKEGVDVTLIVDSSVRWFMNKIDKVIVGADAISANGAVVNKIGTSTVALVAKEARSRFMVAAESYKISPQTFVGELVPIERRSSEEIISRDWMRRNPNVKVVNPAFDITPPEYIDLIITEFGVFPPQSMLLLYKEIYGFTDLFEK